MTKFLEDVKDFNTQVHIVLPVDGTAIDLNTVKGSKYYKNTETKDNVEAHVFILNGNSFGVLIPSQNRYSAIFRDAELFKSPEKLYSLFLDSLKTFYTNTLSHTGLFMVSYAFGAEIAKYEGLYYAAASLMNLYAAPTNNTTAFNAAYQYKYPNRPFVFEVAFKLLNEPRAIAVEMFTALNAEVPFDIFETVPQAVKYCFEEISNVFNKYEKQSDLYKSIGELIAQKSGGIPSFVMTNPAEQPAVVQ